MNLILCTMVRNEEKALPRLIKSCKGVVSHVVVTDTGSTDKTIEVMKAACEEIGVPYNLYNDVWSDFGKNRTNNLVHGRESIKNWGLKPEESYLFLLDADMEVPPNVVKPKVFPEIGLLPQHSPGGLTWWNVRIIRGDIEAKYIGRTHEYISHSGSPIRYDWFTINDHCDGGCRADKYERDERLLRLDLKDNPNNGRSMFYLAQTLQSLHRFNEAIEWYDRRDKVGGFEEECWMGRWEASQCCAALGKIEEANERALAAYASRPQRVEPLAAVASRCADRGQHKRAMALAREGLKVPYPIGEALYCGKGPYTWDCRYALMVSAYYTGALEEGLEACEYLHLTPGSPGSRPALLNLPYYCKPIEGDRLPITTNVEAGWFPSNPDFMKMEDGWMAIIRTVNYKIRADGSYDYPGIVKTRNFIYHYDRALKPTKPPVELIAPPSVRADAVVTGFEDLRIVSWDGAYLTTIGVRLDATPDNKYPEMWRAEWKVETGECLISEKLSIGKNVEKNWLPYNDEFIYKHAPVGVVFADAKGIPTHVFSTPNINITDFRGSASPINYKHGSLYLIHEVAGRGKRIYLHRFIFVPKNDWTKLQVSKPFRFKDTPCIEFCLSIQNEEGGIMMFVSYEDNEIYAIKVKHETIRDLLA